MSKRLFTIEESKPAFSQWNVEIDISDFLDTDAIFDVDFTAVNKYDNSDASSIVLYAPKCIYTGVYLKPYVMGGVSGESYRIRMEVTTETGDKEVFWLDFSVK